MNASSHSTRLIALSAVAVMAFSACSKEESATPAADGSTAVSTSTATTTASADASAAESSSVEASTPGASAAESAASSQTPATDSSATSATPAASGSAAAGSVKPDGQELSAMISSVKIGGKALKPLPKQAQDAATSGAASAQMEKMLKTAQIEPASCKEAVVSSLGQAPKGAPTAIGTTPTGLAVSLISLPDAEAAKKFVEASRSTTKSCPKYTMTVAAQGQKIAVKATTEPVSVTSESSQDESGVTTSSSTAGRTQRTTVVAGHVDNVLVQVTDMQGTQNAAQLSAALEAAAKQVAAR